ncbi:MAG: 30S ribosomal protein S16 [Candidatus Karelsulcia muelleri]|nr:MAG: 30S ribosomal protein S16 [Candidatus Karelsulcia muelleri]
MSLRIRLQRKGRKKNAFYTIVVANSRSSRDGKFLDKIGFYNPNMNPFKVLLNINKAINWLQKGAKPTWTVKSICFLKGVLFKKHLLNGVKKGIVEKSEIKKQIKTWILNKKKEK